MKTKKKTSSVPSSVPSSLTTRPLRLRVDTQPEEVRVELIPLIDVIFCILVFFILAAVGFSRQQAISVDIPKASTGTAQSREILMVSLNDAGQVFVEQQPMASEEQFRQRLRDYRKQKPNGLMALYASTNSTYSQVVQVLDMLRAEGSDRVALATLPGEAGKTNPSPVAPGVPGVPPAPGTNSFDPYGLQNPGAPVNPNQPLSPLPGSLPGVPGTDGLQPLPSQPGITPGTALPSPGAGTPNLNNPGTTTKPGNSTAPSPGTGNPPKVN